MAGSSLDSSVPTRLGLTPPLFNFPSLIVFLLSLSLSPWLHADDPLPTTHPAQAQQSVRLEAAQARAILAQHCFACHGPDRQHRAADLRLDRLPAPQAIVPHDRLASELWQRITATDDSRMPPVEHASSLTSDELEVLGNWIDAGAGDAMNWLTAPLPTSVARATDPSIIDQTLEAAGRLAGLETPRVAEPLVLLRRVHLDLTGLPPRSEMINRFVADPSQEAYEQIVDQLLDSRAYGEHLATFWLDLVRYADTVGFHGDQDHPIWPYRDWVIESLIRDDGFDRFSIAQLAGDLIEPQDEGNLIATGYLRVLQTSHEGGIQPGEYLAKYASDRVRNFSDVWLGLSLGCAECHDHKFDPLTQRDFYRMAAFFADIDDSGTFVGTNTLPTSRAPELEVRSPLDLRRLQEIDTLLRSDPESLDPIFAAGNDHLTSDPAALRQERERIVDRRFRTMIVHAVEPRITRVLSRGDWMDETGEIVLPGTPESLPGLIPSSDQRLTRLDLANWLFRENRATTARVIVNRLWARFFGQGIAASLDDFGVQGDLPVHPDLLDQLAADLIESGWRFKPLIRRFVTSRAYQTAGIMLSGNEPWERVAPFSAGLRRMPLPAETLRDQALAAGGLLADLPGGPSCRPYQPPGFYDHLNFPTRSYQADTGIDQYRRGVYIHRQRQFLHPMLAAFGAPRREECNASRPSSFTSIAALTLLNDPTMVEAARGLARQISRSEQRPRAADWEELWQRVLTRPPRHEELAELERLFLAIEARYLTRPEAARELLGVGQTPDSLLVDEASLARLAAMTFVARAVLNLDETRHRP